MSGGSPRTQTVTNQVQYPDWMEGPMRENIGRANTLADQMGQQGYQSYNPQDRIANFNDLQLNALQSARDSVGNWTPLMQRAANQSGQASQLAVDAAGRPMGDHSAMAAYAGPSAMVQGQNFLQANVGAYMNPYTDLVTRNALGNLEESRQMQNLTNADAAAKAKAFGGSRHGVVEGMTNAGFAKQAGDLSLNAANQNFLNAQGLIQADQNRNLQAQGMNQGAFNQMAQYNAGLGQQANLFNAQQGMQGDLAMRQFGLDAAGRLQAGAGMDASLAGQYQGMNANDINNMMRAGDTLQDQDQMHRDFAYQEWLNQQNFPIDMLNMRFSAINNTPYQPGSSTSQPIYRNRMGGFLGGASAGSAFGVPGAILGGLLGGFG